MTYSKQLQRLFRKVEQAGKPKASGKGQRGRVDTSADHPYQAEGVQLSDEEATALRQAEDAIQEIETMGWFERPRYHMLLANLKAYAVDLRRGVALWQAWNPFLDDPRIEQLALRARERRSPAYGLGASGSEFARWQERERAAQEQAEADRRYVEDRKRRKY